MYRKIPRDLTEASLSGAGLSIVAALAMMFLFGMVSGSYIFSRLLVGSYYSNPTEWALVVTLC